MRLRRRRRSLTKPSTANSKSNDVLPSSTGSRRRPKKRMTKVVKRSKPMKDVVADKVKSTNHPHYYEPDLYPHCHPRPQVLSMKQLQARFKRGRFYLPSLEEEEEMHYRKKILDLATLGYLQLICTTHDGRLPYGFMSKLLAKFQAHWLRPSLVYYRMNQFKAGRVDLAERRKELENDPAIQHLTRGGPPMILEVSVPSDEESDVSSLDIFGVEDAKLVAEIRQLIAMGIEKPVPSTEESDVDTCEMKTCVMSEFSSVKED